MKMRRLIFRVVSALVMMITCVEMALTPVEARAARARVTNLPLWELEDASVSRIRYDVTGDGRQDWIVARYGNWSGTCVYLSINGQQMTLRSKGQILGLDLCTVRLANGRFFLCIMGAGDDCTGDLFGVYSYTGKRFRNEFDVRQYSRFPRFEVPFHISASGNTITFEYQIYSNALGPLCVNVSACDRGGRLKLKNRYVSVTKNRGDTAHYLNKDWYYHASRTLRLYRRATTRQIGRIVRPGQKVKVTQVYIGPGTVRYKCIVKNGGYGWLEEPQRYGKVLRGLAKGN